MILEVLKDHLKGTYPKSKVLFVARAIWIAHLNHQSGYDYRITTIGSDLDIENIRIDIITGNHVRIPLEDPSFQQLLEDNTQLQK